MIICFLLILKHHTNIQILKFKERNKYFYSHYINNCYKLKKYKINSIRKNIPFVSICLPVYNMEKYIESTILSILNQSFQDFEVVIVNDNSNDKTSNILQKFILNNKITIINNSKNLGLYASRVIGTLNSKGQFIILMDPDDMLLNPDILTILYNYYLKYNLDIIEYKIYYYEEKTKKLYINNNKFHYHFFNKPIIYQPELSNVLFLSPLTKKYSSVICTVVWNKIIRRDVLMKTIYYLGEDYYKNYCITADDTLVNVINLQFANNYTNIKYSGYMYNIRETSMSHGKKNIKNQILFSYNYLMYNKKLYKYIKDFNKDRNFFFYELQRTNFRLIELKKLDKSKSSEINQFYKEIIEDKKISSQFKEYLMKFLINLLL